MPVTTIEAVMQMRRGLENDLDISQLRVGEWALSTDMKWVRICYAPNKVLKIASQEAMDETLEEIREIEDAIIVMRNSASASATSASSSATSAGESSEDAEAWAVGKRGGVDVPSTDPTYNNNAKYWAQNSTIPTGGTTGQVLAKKTNSDRDTEWVNQSGGVSTLAGLTDTDINSPSNNEVLKYNSTSGKWENSQESSGGHTIKNDAGTALTQRTNLQFKGVLQATDDSTNDATVVQVSGESVHANMLTKLWENPNPNVAFAAQNIELSSDDYDFTFWVANYAGSVYTTIIIPKGRSGMFFLSGTTGGSYTITAQRDVARVSDTEFSIGSAMIQNSNAARSINNVYFVPIAVYGFKKSLDITAIVSNVSTDATKCILSDNVTNVDDAVKYKLVTLTGATTSVAANSYATISLSGSIPSGYTPISIIKFEAGNTGIDVELVSTNYMRVYNNMGSAKNAAPEVIVACVKSSIVS